MRLLFLFITFNIHYCIAMKPLMSDSVLVEKLFEAIQDDKPLIVESMIKERPHLIECYSEKKDFSDHVLGLHVAAAYGNDACLAILLQHKADPNSMTKYKHNTPLHYIQTIKGANLLVCAGAKIDQENAQGRTPLWGVFMLDNHIDRRITKTIDVIRDLAQFLISEGVDINKKDKSFDTLLHCAMRHQCVHATELLLCNQADQDQPDGLGVTPLDMFIMDKQHDGIVQAFAKQGTFFFPKMSPVRPIVDNHEFLNNWASVFSYINKKKDMQDHFHFGSDIVPTRGGIMCNKYGCMVRNVSYKDLEQFFGQSTVKAIEDNLNEQCQKVIFLVNKGDHKTLRRKIERFPFVTDYRDVFTKLMIKEAIENNDDTVSLEILLNSLMNQTIINVMVLDWGPKLYTQKGTFLHVAVFCKNVKAIKVLMSHKADCLLVDRQKRTPMIYAQTMNRQDCIKQLNELIIEQFLITFNRGDFTKSDQLLEQIIDCNIVMNGGNTLLHNLLHCLNSQTKKYINALICKGANPEELNEDGESPLWHLMKFNKDATDIFEELLRVGARVDRPSSKTHYSLLGLAVHLKKIDLVKLFLKYGALINKKMVEESIGDMKVLLQQAFVEQKCFVCNEHKDNLNDLLCKNRHLNKFICIPCYNRTHSDHNTCPFCSERLN